MFSGMRIDIACGTGFVVEAGFFCTYTCLFIAALPVLTSARRLEDARSASSAWVFLIFSILMYLVAIAHLIFMGFRFYKSIFLHIDPKGPTSYLHDYNQWDYLGLNIVICVQMWLGDALVIYRCYFVWGNNLWLIAVPVCLLFGTIGVNLSTLYWLRHPSAIAAGPRIHLIRSIFPLGFVQNFLTTALIILRIFLQHRASKKAGVRNVGSKLGLMRIIRLIVESAAIYTILLLVLNITYIANDNLQYVVQPTIVPSIGITSVLLALRIEASRHDSATMTNDLCIRSSMVPQQWPCESDHDIDPEDDGPQPAEDDTAATEQKLFVQGDSGMVNRDSELSSYSATQPKANAHAHFSSDASRSVNLV